MKSVLALLLALSAAPALAQPMGVQAGAAAPLTIPAGAEGIGQVKAIDAKAGTITIHHGPIAALNWPAMTMTFKAAPDVLKAAKPGQTVKFTVQPQDNEVVAIQPQ